MTKEFLNVRTVLFDLDGTLADTAPDLADALNMVREHNCLNPLSFDVIRPIVSHGTNALIYLGFELDPGDEGFDPIREQLLDAYLDNIATKTRLFPGMAEVLDTLEAEGLNWGVVTNKPSWLTEPLMQKLGLAQRAACIVSGDTTAKCKPDPEPMLFACRMAGSRGDQCLYVGDAERDIVAGRRAGMKTLAALFGYISEHEHPAQWGADGTIDQPRDILTWLGRDVA